MLLNVLRMAQTQNREQCRPLSLCCGVGALRQPWHLNPERWEAQVGRRAKLERTVLWKCRCGPWEIDDDKHYRAEQQWELEGFITVDCKYKS